MVQGFESKHLVMEYKGDAEGYLRREWNTEVRLRIGCVKLVRLAKLSKVFKRFECNLNHTKMNISIFLVICFNGTFESNLIV